jgi:peptidoglycan hydrolase-like protein with peptidoglycan-binding domain
MNVLDYLTKQELQSVKEHIHLNENPKNYEFPGLDSKGLITAGSGEQVNTLESFVALPFETNGRLATEKEKQVAFQQLQKEKQNLKGDFDKNFGRYKTTTTLILPKAKAEARLEAKIAEKLPGVVGKFDAEKWRALPSGQKNVLIDTAYSVGSIDGFPKMVDAARRGDAPAMARESFTVSGDKRNWERNQRNHATILGKKFNDPETEKTFVHDFLKDKRHKAEDLPRNLIHYAPKPGDTEIKGGAKDDVLGEGILSAPQPVGRPEVKAFLEDVKKPLDDDKEIMLKDPRTWTREELNKVMTSKDYMTLGKPERQQAYEKVASWFSEHYGDEPVERMISGQMMQPDLKRQPNKTPLAPVTADGHDMAKASAEVGSRVAEMAGKKTLTSAVKALQSGLNLMAKNGALAPLKQDGVFGPKTKTALRTTLTSQGKAKTEEAFGLGNINRLAQKTRKFGNAQGLERSLDKAVAPLFGAKPARSPKPTYKPWGEALQGVINDTGSKAFGAQKWEPIKEDGLVGPKTENAFATIAKRVEPEEVSKQFGGALGWL